MKNLYLILSIFIITLIFSHINVFSQIPEIPSEETLKKQMNTPRMPCNTNEPFDLKAIKLPINYRGNDLVTITGELKRRTQLIKDEFETTKDFIERVKIEKSKNIVGNLSTESLFAFVIDEGKFKFDADTEKMFYDAAFKTDLKWSPGSCLPGTSSFTYQIHDEKFKMTDGNDLPIQLEFKIGIEKARKTKSNLRALLIGRIVEKNGKYVEGDSFYSYQTKLNFDASELWLYDEATGFWQIRRSAKKAVRLSPTKRANRKRKI